MELNVTLFFQLAIYLCIIFILKTLYFDPLLKLLKRREALTDGRLKESEGLAGEIKILHSNYESRMDEVRRGLDQERSDSIRRVRDSSDQKIQSAKSSVQDRMSKAAEELQKDVKEIRGRLPQLSSDIAREISSAILNSRVVRP